MFSLFLLLCPPVALVTTIWGWEKWKACRGGLFILRTVLGDLAEWMGTPFFIVGEEAMTLFTTALTFWGIWQRKTVG